MYTHTHLIQCIYVRIYTHTVHTHTHIYIGIILSNTLHILYIYSTQLKQARLFLGGWATIYIYICIHSVHIRIDR